jgi:hypothetical protein
METPLTIYMEVGWFHRGRWRGEKILAGPFENGKERSDWLSVFWHGLDELNKKLQLVNRDAISGDVKFDHVPSGSRFHQQKTGAEVILKEIEKLFASVKSEELCTSVRTE